MKTRGLAWPALFPSRDHDALGVDELLTRLEKSDARRAKVVEVRFLGGLTLDEVAESL